MVPPLVRAEPEEVKRGTKGRGQGGGAGRGTRGRWRVKSYVAASRP